MTTKKCYIAGRVTGEKREKSEEKFRRAEDMIKRAGLQPVNPLKIAQEADSTREAMKKLLPELLQCDSILLLDDWEFSEGARIEALLARYAGMHIMNEDIIK